MFLAVALALAAPVKHLDRVAIAGVEDPSLQVLLDDHWGWAKERWPDLALSLREASARYRFTDRSPPALKSEAETTAALLARVRALNISTMSDADHDTAVMLIDVLDTLAAEEACGFDRWRVSWNNNALADANRFAGAGAELSAVGASRVVAWTEHVPLAVDAEIQNLRLGLAEGRVADRDSVRRVLADLDQELPRPESEWAMTAPARAPHPEWDARTISAFSTALYGAALTNVRPALERYRTFLREEVLPVARDESTPGLAGLPGGSGCYSRLVSAYLDQPADYAAIGGLGVTELARVEGELRPLGASLFGVEDPAAIFERLRTDPALYFHDADEIEDAAQSAVHQSHVGLRRWFDRRPRAEVQVARIPEWSASDQSAGYYSKPSPDGQKPGRYFVNTSRPETRPRFEARALAFHEAVPGHHLQQTLGVRDEDLPAFRRFLVYTPLTEGWALYAEGLAAEMGLYKTDLDRIGRLTMASLRAARLVVDVGLHAEGWSRTRAVDFLLAHTALRREQAQVEVERYLDRPGQALTYAVGEREVWALRREAEGTLGAAFDLRAFHATLLTGGEVSIPLAREHVNAWQAAVLAP